MGIQKVDYKLGSIEIFPNPNNGIFTISVSNTSIDEGVLRIYNYTGQQVSESEVSFANRNAMINLKDLPAGLYYIEISNSNLRCTGKLIIN